jgi:hypothetical protein
MKWKCSTLSPARSLDSSEQNARRTPASVNNCKYYSYNSRQVLPGLKSSTTAFSKKKKRQIMPIALNLPCMRRWRLTQVQILSWGASVWYARKVLESKPPRRRRLIPPKAYQSSTNRSLASKLDVHGDCSLHKAEHGPDLPASKGAPERKGGLTTRGIQVAFT